MPNLSNRLDCALKRIPTTTLLGYVALWAVAVALVLFLATGLNTRREWLILGIAILGGPVLGYMALALGALALDNLRSKRRFSRL